MLRPFPALALLVACAGDDPAGPGEPTCEGLETTPLGQVDVNDWPSGTLEAHAALQAFPGRYAALDSCTGATTYVKIQATQVQREALNLVTSPYVDGPCGCAFDPGAEADSEYPMVATVAGSSIFVENGVEAGAQNASVPTELTLFQDTSPLVARACGSLVLEPVVGSAYDRIEVVARLRDGGIAEGSYTLVGETSSMSCDLTGWTLEAVE